MVRLNGFTIDIVRYLLPNGKKSGSEWRVGSVKGEQGESLSVRLTGEKSGIWADFDNGSSGDLLDLWAATRQLTLTESIKEAAQYLGICKPQFESHKPLKFSKPKLSIARMNENSDVMSYLKN